MTHTTIIYFSGYGHTTKQAEAVYEGANIGENNKASLIKISEDGNITDQDWETLAASDAIIFGSPTYMGGTPWQFKKFADASSKPWFAQRWKDKIAAGFTNSASINGDKNETIHYFITLAMQHSMIWVGPGILPANQKNSHRNDINWLGGFAGAYAQSPADASPEEGPLPGDLATAKLLGTRVVEMAQKFRTV